MILGIDIDGVLVNDFEPKNGWTPELVDLMLTARKELIVPLWNPDNLQIDDTFLVSSRPKVDYEDTLLFVNSRFPKCKLVMGDHVSPLSTKEAAALKATLITSYKVTHYIESCPRQSSYIREFTTGVVVYHFSSLLETLLSNFLKGKQNEHA